MKIAPRNLRIEQQKEKSWRYPPASLIMLTLGVFLLAVIIVAVSFGSTSIPIATITQILLNGTGVFHFTRQWDRSAELIIWQVRLPVVLGAAFVGAALAVAGVLFQGMLRNPLADRWFIGTCSGCASGAPS